MITCNITKLETELFDIARLFDYTGNLHVDVRQLGTSAEITINGGSGSAAGIWEYAAGLTAERALKYTAKSALYAYLSGSLGITHSWGALTGIRPVRLYTSLCEQLGNEIAGLLMSELFFVTPEKMQVIKDIQSVQQPILSGASDTVSVYVGIPFCKGRCSYCSFYSADIDKSGGLIGGYTDAVIKEIKGAVRLLSGKTKKLGSVYVGGGTPSSIDRAELGRILHEVGKLPGIDKCEYTVEAGRPDSIDRELITLLNNHGVNRISINTQSSCDETLIRIGRNHTFKDVLKAFDVVSGSGLSVNTDIISSLPGESREVFLQSVEDVCKLYPDNITVHALALKRGSSLAETDFKHDARKRQTDEAYALLTNKGYNPYYLYRQKNAADNAENIGYSLSGKACVYNIHNMDDTVNIIACGANAISKRVYGCGRIERLCAPKDIATYINKADKLTAERELLFAQI